MIGSKKDLVFKISKQQTPLAVVHAVPFMC